jgi:hypothetical protein
MDEEHHNGAAALYAHNIVKLKHTSSPFADKERLLGEIATIEQHVGRRMRYVMIPWPLFLFIQTVLP